MRCGEDVRVYFPWINSVPVEFFGECDYDVVGGICRIIYAIPINTVFWRSRGVFGIARCREVCVGEAGLETLVVDREGSAKGRHTANVPHRRFPIGVD